MADFSIRVLGRVDLVEDGAIHTLPAQQARLLALVIATDRPVPSIDISRELWPAADDNRRFVHSLVRRLNERLTRGGLTLRQINGGYSLAADKPDLLTQSVDVYRFQAAVQRGQELLADGDNTAALASFRAAVGEWRGEPFEVPDPEWIPPEGGRFGCRELTNLRGRLIEKVAQHLIRSGDYAQAAFLDDSPPLRSVAEKVDVMWLLTVLRALRDKGPAAAEVLVESRRTPKSYDSLPLRGAELSDLVLVGRTRDLARLSSVVNEAVAGTGPALIVQGPPGIGKTRLLQELVQMTDQAVVHLEWVACRQLDELEEWRVLAGRLYAHVLKDLDVDHDLSRPEGKALWDLVRPAAHGTHADPESERDLRDLVSLLVTLINRVAQCRGLVIVFDDAHQLSSSAVRLLTSVRERLGPARVAFVLGRRIADGGEQDLPMQSVTLLPLSRDEVREWLHQVWPRKPAISDIDIIYRKTGGVPLELRNEVDATGVLRESQDQATAIPSRWLAAAAVIAVGREIDIELVAAMLHLTQDEADREQAAAFQAGHIDVDEGPRFRHDMIREHVLYQLALDPGLDRHLNHRAFDLLSQRLRSTTQPPATLPVRVAKHAQSAKSALTTQQFATACLDAARAEQRGFARNAAIDWAEKGLAVECDVTTRFDLLLTLGNAHNDNDDLRGAARAYQDAYDIAETIPRQRAAAAILIARTWSDPGQVDERSVHLLKANRDALRPDDSAEAAALRSQLNAHLARKLTMSVVQYEQQPPGVLLARNTIASLPTDVNDSVRCEVLNECRWALYDYTPPNELLSISGQLRDASIRARSVYFHSEALVALAIDQIRLGRLDDAFGTVSRHGRYVTQNNRPLGSWLQHTLETMRQLWTGEFDAAESWLYGESVQVVSGLLRSPAVPGDTLHQTRMGQVYWFLHERGLMRQRFQTDLATNVQQHGYFPIWQAGRVLALCDLEAHDTAFDQLTVLMRETSDFASLPPHGWAVPTLSLLAEACAALHLTQSMTDLAPFINRLLELLAPHSGQVALAGWPTVLIGPVDRFIGVLLLAAGDTIEALAYLERAEKVVAAAPPQLARLRLDQARAIVAISGARSAGRVVDLLRRAGKSAEELKMQLLVTQIQTLLAELDESS